MITLEERTLIHAPRERCFDLAQGKAHSLALPNDLEWRAINWSLVDGLRGLTLISCGWSVEATSDLARHLVKAGTGLVIALVVVKDGQIPTIEYRSLVPRLQVAA